MSLRSVEFFVLRLSLFLTHSHSRTKEHSFVHRSYFHSGVRRCTNADSVFVVVVAVCSFLRLFLRLFVSVFVRVWLVGWLVGGLVGGQHPSSPSCFVVRWVALVVRCIWRCGNVA